MRLHTMVVVATAVAAAPAPAFAQLVLGATVGAVKYDSQSTTSSFALNPEIRVERPRFVLDAGGGYTSGSDGGRVTDGGGTIWGATLPTPSHIQLDGLFQVSLTHPQADSSSSALFGLGEVAWALADRGVAAGIGTVQATIAGTPTVGALRTEVRGWYVVANGDVTLTGSVEPTRLSGAWFWDYTAGAEWTPGPWDISAGVRLRQLTSSSMTMGGAGSASYDVTPRWSVELDAGRYLRDPYQGLPPGFFISLGVKLKVATWRSGTGEGVGAANLGDVSLKAAERSFGFAAHGSAAPGTGAGTGTGRTTSSGTTTRGTGNGHRPF